MELSFLDLKEREIINVYDGKKLGRIIDIVFNNETGIVRGIVVPGDKKMFRKDEDIFIPIDKIKRIGGDVILVGLQREDRLIRNRSKKDTDKNIKIYENYYNRNYNLYNGSQNDYRERISSRDIIRNKQAQNSNLNANFEQNSLQNANNYQKSFVRLRPINKNKYK